jgi:hypothetical protein
MAIEKIKSLELFWSYQLDSTANPAHLPKKWTKLAVLFSLWLQRGHQQDLIFFQLSWVRNIHFM